AIVRRVRDEIGGDVAAGPAAVLDDELLTEQPRERLCEHARRDVAGGAGAEADDDAHRPGRIVFRFGNLCDRRERGSAHGQLQKTATGERHGGPSLERTMPFILPRILDAEYRGGGGLLSLGASKVAMDED